MNRRFRPADFLPCARVAWRTAGAGRARTRQVIGLLALLAAPLPALLADAIVEGRVALPQEREAPVVNQRYEVVTRAGVLSTNPPLAVVYLEGRFPPAVRETSYEVTQRDMEFVPALLPIRVGSRVAFPNLDDTYHNIFSFSAPKRFDLGRYRPDERPVPSVLFDQPGLVVLRCDIHEHMRGLILVLDTPHFVTTAPDGTFRLAGLPAGKYTLKVWINSRSTLAREVELRDGVTQRLEFP